MVRTFNETFFVKCTGFGGRCCAPDHSFLYRNKAHGWRDSEWQRRGDKDYWLPSERPGPYGGYTTDNRGEWLQQFLDIHTHAPHPLRIFTV